MQNLDFEKKREEIKQAQLKREEEMKIEKKLLNQLQKIEKLERELEKEKQKFIKIQNSLNENNNKKEKE